MESGGGQPISDALSLTPRAAVPKQSTTMSALATSPCHPESAAACSWQRAQLSSYSEDVRGCPAARSPASSATG